ncbi:TIGR01841 family phasin [Paraburkholderia sp. BL10I2N1]|uniref:TIGR01841 family phasin n=1 Tax=Paraburkholderia sp. BL10I2N1 TaxID=1938796 RepID=UPI00105E4816|nr:TIGR01841 family phasin [Paraburkholderia sp. BL10I2N1]TDN58683.1 phasin family protein [Paraburkholderia sp. BL10I2N1]
MNLSTPEQIAASQKPSLDTAYGLATNAVVGIERLAELNLKTIQSTLAETQQNALKAFSVKDPQEWLGLQAAPVAPTAEKVQSYSRQLFEIVSATQGEFAQVVQTQYEAYNRRVQTLVEGVARSAPAGSEAAIAGWKSAIGAAHALVETLQKTSRQAVQVAESTFDAVATAASKTARRTAEQASAGARR